MNTTSIDFLDMEELCQATELPTAVVVEIVTHGIIEPQGEEPTLWRFDALMVTRVRKACRLRRDFDLDWPGIALALQLLDQLEEERRRNAYLQQRLQRFLMDTERL